MTLTKQIGKRTKIDVDSNKIIRHESKITGLELYLSEDRSGISAKVSLNGFNDRSYSIRRWSSLDQPREEYLKQARREYQEILKKFRNGEYKIDVYGDGKVEVTLLD